MPLLTLLKVSVPMGINYQTNKNIITEVRCSENNDACRYRNFTIKFYMTHKSEGSKTIIKL